MNITIKSAELDQLKELPQVAKFLEYNSWNPRKSMKIDVAALTLKDLSMVTKILSKDPRGNACPLDVIKQWSKVRENPNDAKPRTLEQFATILKNFIRKAPKYMVFKQNEDSDWLPYVVSSVGYQPPKRSSYGTSPAYTYMKLKYYEHGKIHDETLRFYARDIESKTCSQIMDRSGYILGTDDLVRAHEAETEKYKRYRAAVGLQVLGSGMGEVIGEEQRWWGSSKTMNTVTLDPEGRKSRMVVDDQEENEEDRSDRGEKAQIPLIDGNFWKGAAVSKDDDDEDNELSDDTEIQLEVPLHPTILCFHLEKHSQLWVHVNRLEDYAYDKTLGGKLVLPAMQKDLIEILVQRDHAEFRDIIEGKAGGSIVLCSGSPGTGKTLTAEVFAEAIERPLYVIQSCQLGTSAEELETEPIKVLTRASRWGAILLIDEADVFIHERGEDIEQNAVVGVFLRVLEYYQGVLFMTTNRATIVDDAIVSRCTAQVKFQIPSVEGQSKIWRILADASKIKLSDAEIAKFAKRHPKLSGRDVKGLLKLANMVSVKQSRPVNCDLIEHCMQFKPTAETVKEVA